MNRNRDSEKTAKQETETESSMDKDSPVFRVPTRRAPRLRFEDAPTSFETPSSTGQQPHQVSPTEPEFKDCVTDNWWSQQSTVSRTPTVSLDDAAATTPAAQTDGEMFQRKRKHSDTPSSTSITQPTSNKIRRQEGPSTSADTQSQDDHGTSFRSFFLKTIPSFIQRALSWFGFGSGSSAIASSDQGAVPELTEEQQMNEFKIQLKRVLNFSYPEPPEESPEGDKLISLEEAKFLKNKQENLKDWFALKLQTDEFMRRAIKHLSKFYKSSDNLRATPFNQDLRSLYEQELHGAKLLESALIDSTCRDEPILEVIEYVAEQMEQKRREIELLEILRSCNVHKTV